MAMEHRMDHEHSPAAIRARLAAGPRHNYLRDWVYGGQEYERLVKPVVGEFCLHEREKSRSQ